MANPIAPRSSGLAAGPSASSHAGSSRWRRGRARATAALLALAAVAAVLAALAAPAPAAAASPYGVNIHAPQGSDLTLILDRVRQAGIGWVRIDFVWAYVETSRGVFDWSVYDALTAAADSRGIEIYATLAYTPAWATQGPPITGVPDDPATWADFCGRAAKRYAGSIHHWGLWNEPNLAQFWSGSLPQYIYQILIPGADAIHAASPTARVGGPELSHLANSQWFYWLHDTLRQAGDHLDFITHHIYDNDGSEAVTNRLEASTLFGGDPSLWVVVQPSVREVLQDAGGWGRPFWLTETGWQSAVVSAATQAADYTGLLNDWFSGLPRRAWVNQIFFYEIQDGPGSPTSWGILRADGSAKPAYIAYENFITAHTFQPVDGAQLLGSTLPTSMETGQTITVRLTFKNTGTSTWTAAAGYRLGAEGDQDPFTSNRQLLAPGEAIAPGRQKTFVFDLTAPTNPGTYHTQWQMLKEGVARFGDFTAQDVAVTQAPPPAQRDLRLLSGRFQAEVSWHDPLSGHAGFGRQVGGSDQSGFFWFFDPANLELVVKALDGRPVNDHFWLFYGALSNVEYWLEVTDLATGAVRRYYNPPGNLCGGADTSAFPLPAKSRSSASADPASAASAASAAPDPGRLPAAGAAPGATAPTATAPTVGWAVQPFAAGSGNGSGGGAVADASGSCVPGAQTLCLLGSRFSVQVRWSTSTATGTGTAAPESDQSGTFWFFDPANLELIVKVLDGRALTGHFWVFYGALSDVEYWVTVTDTATGDSKRYHNPPGNICGVGDTSALD
jgi:Ig-like domain from next to BRCA1 gene/Glycosyl hydrolases family 39